MAPSVEVELKRDEGSEERSAVKAHPPCEEQNTVYTFTDVGFLTRYLSSFAFRRMIDSGKYAYVDGRVVLNSPDCLQYQYGRLLLKKCVYDSPPIYCLRLIKRSVHSRRTRFSTHRERSYEKESTYHHAVKIRSFKEVTLENVLNFTGGTPIPPWNFGKELIRLMEERHITEEQLAELTGLSEKTIQRMRNSDERPSLCNIIALAVAMSLCLWDSLALIKYAGYELTESREERLFRAILMCTEENSVYDCNRMLERLHMKPLTKL